MSGRKFKIGDKVVVSYGDVEILPVTGFEISYRVTGPRYGETQNTAKKIIKNTNEALTIGDTFNNEIISGIVFTRFLPFAYPYEGGHVDFAIQDLSKIRDLSSISKEEQA